MNHLKGYTKFNESNYDNLIDEMITYFRKQFLKSNFSIRHKAITRPTTGGLTTYTFSYKGEIYDITIISKTFKYYSLNDKSIDTNLGRILTEILSKIFNNTNNFLRWIWKNIESDDAELQEDFSFVRNSLCERCDEFEIIKNGKIDLISLNQLYDFYNAPFDEEKIEIELSMRNFI